MQRQPTPECDLAQQLDNTIQKTTNVLPITMKIDSLLILNTARRPFYLSFIEASYITMRLPNQGNQTKSLSILLNCLNTVEFRFVRLVQSEPHVTFTHSIGQCNNRFTDVRNCYSSCSRHSFNFILTLTPLPVTDESVTKSFWYKQLFQSYTKE